MHVAIRIPIIIFLLLALMTACERDSSLRSEAASKSVIVRGNGGDPGSLDPALAEDIHAFNILTDLYEGLVALSAEGSVVPGAASSWTVSDDRLVYTFTLRENAAWSNGERVTSEDFVRSYRRVMAPSSTSAYGFLLEPVADMVATDPRTLRIHLHEAAPHLLSILSMPVAYPLPDGIDRFSDPATFVGNGPYVLAEHAPGAATRLARSSTYWDAASVAVEEIVYLPIVEPSAELNMYRAGEIDITHTVPGAQFSMLAASMPGALRVAPSLALYYLAFDLTEPPLDDVRLRQALSMAVDREQLVALIGRGERAAYGLVPAGVADYSGARLAWHDVADGERERAARELYREAGYGHDRPLTIKYTYDTGDVHEKIALAIASMWREVLGVEVALEKKEWQLFLDTRDDRGAWQVMRFAWFGDYNHASTFTNIFRSDDEIGNICFIP